MQKNEKVSRTCVFHSRCRRCLERPLRRMKLTGFRVAVQSWGKF